MREPDGVLRLFERDIAIAAVTFAALSMMAPGGGIWVGVSTLTGGALAWFSFATIRATVDATLRRGGRPWALVKVFTRYAILAVAAYVILARFRLHPVGVVIGTTALAAAAAATAVRMLRLHGWSRAGR